MKVLFLCDGLAPFVIGGMQQHSTMLVKHLAPLVDHITLMHCGKVNEEPPTKADVLLSLGRPSNVEVIGVKFEDRGSFPGHYLRASKRLSLSFLRRAGALHEYEVVYAQGLTGNAFFERHNRVVVNLHGLNMFQPSFSLSDRLRKEVLKRSFRTQIMRAWRVVSLGGALSDILENEGAQPAAVIEIPNAIETKWILPEEARRDKLLRKKGCKTRYVLIGRYDVCKGLSVLKKALDRIPDSIEVHFIGNWPLWKQKRHTLIFHGEISDKEEVMAKLDCCDTLLVPSLSEGAPTVILEAAARGLSILASDVGTISTWINKSNLLPPGNVESLTDAMLLGKAGEIDDISLYTWEVVASKTFELLSTFKE